LCGGAGLLARRLQLQPTHNNDEAQRVTIPGVQIAALKAAHAFSSAWIDERMGARKANLEWRLQGRRRM
jgi:hypothetical protein